jgi:hypothetical protein
MIQIIENNVIHSLDHSYDVVKQALEFYHKERERHRVKARRIYNAKKAKFESDKVSPVEIKIGELPSGTSA